MDFDQLIILALDNNIILLETDTEEDVIRKLQHAGLLQFDIANEIPDDVIPIIQSYLPRKNFGQSLTVSKVFHQLERLDFQDIVAWNYDNPIPKYITKVKIGGNVTNKTVANATHLKYLDLDWNQFVTDDGIENLVGLVTLKTTAFISDKGIAKLTNLKKLIAVGWKISKGIENLPKLIALDIDSSGIRNEFSKLSNLIYLVTNNRTKNNDIKNLVNLQYLVLNGDIMTDDCLENLVNLKVLDIGINDIDYRVINKLPKLKILILDKYAVFWENGIRKDIKVLRRGFNEIPSFSVV